MFLQIYTNFGNTDCRRTHMCLFIFFLHSLNNVHNIGQLENVLPYIISVEQNGFIKGCQLFFNTRTL